MSKNTCGYNCYRTDGGNCTECDLGWFGVNCNKSCINGFYGKLCKTSCECETSMCNKTTGCPTLYKLKNSQDSISGTPNWSLIAFVAIGTICVLAAGGFLCKHRNFNCSPLQHQKIITVSHHSLESQPDGPDPMRRQEENSFHHDTRLPSIASREIDPQYDTAQAHDYNVLSLRTRDQNYSFLNQDFNDLYCDVNLETSAQLSRNMSVNVREDEEENKWYSVAIMIRDDEIGGHDTSI
ncbi:putative EGF-like and EMI domain-containing protein 1 isoform X2 [Ostrea edulis]|uniref:putative EGF-like and EMI domain-containing protein 1 isoform X2 n=1 Tax=Ostrea edulis TaxID=37623 RepID=UPI0024AFD6DB|nr:putative EGF-like and EMI domain-containing protein 1 isoform X2 [Ostrea edulis]